MTLYVKMYLFVFLCFTTIKFEVFSSQLENIRNNVSIVNTGNKHVKTVTLFKKVSYDLLMYSPETEENNEEFMQTNFKVNACYYALSCYFADWTTKQLHNFLQEFPLFYQRKFLNTKYDLIFKNNVNAFLLIIKYFFRYVKMFVNILSGLIDLYRLNLNNLYYNDTTILKSLLSLEIKMNCILSVNDKNQSEFIESDMVIIREMLEVFNTIQSFSIMNCETQPRLNSEDSEFYGYSFIQNKYDNETILSDIISIFGNNYASEVCSVDQTFLEHIVENDNISVQIFDAKLIIGSSLLSIKDIYEKIRPTYDIDNIYWYLTSVITTIMKLIYYKILCILQTQEYISNDITNKIKVLNSKISEKIPTIVVDGFTLLSIIYDDGNNSMDDKINKLFNFYRSMDNISIEDINLWFNINLINPTKHTARGKNKMYDLNEAEITESSNINTDDIDLTIFLTKLIDNFDDLICFNRYYKYLHNEYHEYNVPLSQLTNMKLISINNNNNNNIEYNEVCMFIFDMYVFCYEAITSLNKAIDKESLKNDDYFKHINNTLRTIKDIQHYFFTVIKTNNKDIDFLIIAHNIVIILENQQKITEFTSCHNLKRIINLIMIELNYYGIQYCSLPKYNFLLINNANFIQFRTNIGKELFGEEIKYLDNGHLDFSTTKPQDYNCLNVDYLCNILAKNSNIFIKIRNNLKVPWKGKLLNIQNICEDIMYLFLNPRNLCALYDIIFKIHIVLAFVEIMKIYNPLINVLRSMPEIEYTENLEIQQPNKNIESSSQKRLPKFFSRPYLERLKVVKNKPKVINDSKDKTTSEEIINLNFLSSNNFPEKFNHLIHDINDRLAYITLPKNKNKFTSVHFIDDLNKIKTEIVNLNIAINENTETYLSNTIVQLIEEFSSTIYNKMEELSTNLKPFYECHSTFINKKIAANFDDHDNFQNSEIE